MEGRIERFLGGSQGGAWCKCKLNLAVDKVLTRTSNSRSTCRFRQGGEDELVKCRGRCPAPDAQYWQSYTCAGQHVLDKLLSLSCIVSPLLPSDSLS